jgi:general secretion pathway protein D
VVLSDAIIALNKFIRHAFLQVFPMAENSLRGALSVRRAVTKRWIRPAIVAAIVAVVAFQAVAKDQAKLLYKKGQDAEARQNYELAYDCYKKAYDLKPTDLTYRASFERLRFLAGASHVHRGQLLREAGQLQDALEQFKEAADIDPSSAIAHQEAVRTQKMIDAASGAAPQSAAKPPSALQKRIEDASGPIDLAPISNTPINLKITEDSKVIYETVGKLAGINVIFDPDYTSKRIKIELNNVSLEDALQIIALESRTFWRPVTPNTIFVATDNPAKRKDVEQSVIKTFYLANLSQPTELQDIVNALRQILEIARVQPLPSEGALVVRGTPDQIALAQKLVSDLDKAKPEVIVDVAVMQVSRDKARTLGISPPTSATVALQNNISTTTTNTGSSTISGTTNNSTSSGTPNQINLNQIANLNATDFTITIPPASATALFTDNSTKLIQKPEIRAVDGQKASLKIGDRVPVATGSFQPGIGGVGINPLVNTQFQYLDVGVNIDITPKIHAGGEVTLKVAMDISSVTGTSNIGGISQPVIGQRKIEHEIRLKEGEVNVMGGMLEDSQTKSLTGIPGLAQIPILKYLFGQTQTDHSENEIVFVLIPHIVRAADITDMNQRALDVGTANAIELRRVSHTVQVPDKPAAASPAQTPAAPAGAGVSPASASPQAAVPVATPVQTVAAQTASVPAAAASPVSAGVTFSLDPATTTQKAGAMFPVNVMISGAQNAYSVPLQVGYDPKILQVINVSNGNFLSQDGQAVAVVHRNDDSSGTLQITATRPPGVTGVSGVGTVVTVTFMAKAAGQSVLVIGKGAVLDPAMQSTTVPGAMATVTVQ